MSVKKLTEAFGPCDIEIEDESRLHAGHVGNPQKDGQGETHFRLRIVSNAFQDDSRIARHRRVFDALREEMKHIHALSITPRTFGEAQHEPRSGDSS